jgi:hypothetical protein
VGTHGPTFSGGGSEGFLRFMNPKLIPIAKSLWVLEYSHQQKHYHYHTLESALKINRHNREGDWQIIHIGENDGEVSHLLELELRNAQ